MTDVQAIDFEKMKQDALTKASKVYTFKHASREDLFNILQDMRHIVMFDLRPKQDYYSWHIRNSYCVEEAQNNENELLALMEEVDKKYAQEESKTNTKPIRRAFIINTNQKPYSDSEGSTKFVLDAIKKYGGFDKVYNLKQGIENFTEKYPFLCINLHERDQAKLAKKEETKADDKPILNDFEKKWLYSLSRFPTELIEGKLYLGSVHNANNKKQMQDLKIQSIVEFISYGEQKISEDKIANYNYKNIPVDKDTIFCIDFDEICKYIDELLGDNSKSPVLIACRDGDTISPCFAIAYLMWHKKASLTIASVTVFQKRGTVDANKQLYTVLTTWQPKGGENKGTALPGWFGK